MSVVDRVEKEWEACYGWISRGEFLRSLSEGRFTLPSYAIFLRETYHNAAMNPRLGSLFHAHLEPDRPALVARFLKHNASEVGHDELALADLRALGWDTEPVRRGRPLPSTEAFTAFISFQIQHRNPMAYLGYLYHLEGLPTRLGEESIAALLKIGIPAEAMSFLKEHAEADQAHMRLNQEYLAGLARSEADIEAVLYGLRGACSLHGLMLQGVMEESVSLPGDWTPKRSGTAARI
jgi:pyrroloquinoline quinone (PQQ) biosynthesis protein C